jgi:hypothetical protein
MSDFIGVGAASLSMTAQGAVGVGTGREKGRDACRFSSKILLDAAVNMPVGKESGTSMRL